MRDKFKRIILYARQHRTNESISETLQRLRTWLKKKQFEVYVDVDTASSVSLDLPLLPREEMGEAQDLIVVVGGDGSLLSAARMAVDVDVPVIGINRGRLGFLTDISPLDMLKQLESILNGVYQEELRFLLHTRIHDKEAIYFQGKALNDVVLSRGDETHLVEFEVLIDDQLVTSFRADGMIISTPTGSTAYALSAGGPIMQPKLDAIVLVPMCSHSLSSRPLVIDGNVNVDLKVSENNERDLRISCDGHESHFVKNGQMVTVHKFTRHLRLLHPTGYQYYDTLRIKLGWESRFQG